MFPYPHITTTSHHCSVSIFLNIAVRRVYLFTRCIEKNTSHKNKQKTWLSLGTNDKVVTLAIILRRATTCVIAYRTWHSYSFRARTRDASRSQVQRPPCIDCCIRLHQALTSLTRITVTTIPWNTESNRTKRITPLPILLASIPILPTNEPTQFRAVTRYRVSPKHQTNRQWHNRWNNRENGNTDLSACVYISPLNSSRFSIRGSQVKTRRT